MQAQVTATIQEQKSEKNFIVTLLLCFFAGPLGLHRFYAGKIGTGILMFFTLGGLFIWSFIDLIVILIGNFKDSDGLKIKS